jgi:hypothetical protein
MVANGSLQHVLPKELMAMQLGQIDLLMAMYAPDNAVTIDASSLDLVEILREWCNGDQDTIPDILDSSIDILLNLDLSDADSLAGDEARPLHLSLTIPLKYEGQLEMDPPAIKARLQQPAWMSKTQVAQLNMDLPEEDILTIIRCSQIKSRQRRTVSSTRMLHWYEHGSTSRPSAHVPSATT